MKSTERRTNAIPFIQMSARLILVAETLPVGFPGFTAFGSRNYGMALNLIYRQEDLISIFGSHSFSGNVTYIIP